jgi:tRNA(Ile)-lysidine synthase
VKATLAIRQAVRPWVQSADHRILLGVSGGADSLALAIGTIAEARAAEIEVVAIIIDHQLQRGSAEVAEECKATLLKLGLMSVEIIAVSVELIDGMESSARRARYAAFESAISKYQPDYFLLAHTKNDQAESVLLGLARGSGTRSLSGIAEVKGRYVRPLLGIDRATTEAACAENQITPWVDPHNSDPSYARVKVRTEILPLLENRLGPGIIDALARSAGILREDADALDQIAAEFFLRKNPSSLDVSSLEELPKAVRMRVLRAAIYHAGAPEGSLGADHIAPVEALVTNWHGQGEISLPGGVKVERISGRLSLSPQNS